MTRYDTALDTVQETESVVATPEDIRKARDIVQDARVNAEILRLRRRAETAIQHLDKSNHKQAVRDFEAVLTGLEATDREVPALHETALRGRLIGNLERIREQIQEAESLFADASYHEAQSSLADAQQRLDTIHSETPEPHLSESVSNLLKVCTELKARCADHRDAIKRTLTNPSADPSLRPVADIDISETLTRGDGPDLQALYQNYPTADRIWKAIAPNRRRDYTTLRSLDETLRDTDLKQWMDTDCRRRIEDLSAGFEEYEPIADNPPLDALAEEYRKTCVEISTFLVDSLDQKITLVVESELPSSYYNEPSTLDDSPADGLADIDELETFKREWLSVVDEAVTNLSRIEDAASIIESYDDVADVIREELTDTTTVTAEDLRVAHANRFLELYAFRNQGVSFDSEREALRKVD